MENNLFFKGEKEFWLTFIVFIFWISVSVIFILPFVVAKISLKTILFIYMIILSFIIIRFGLMQLSDNRFKKLKMFWWTVIPFINIISMIIFFIHLTISRLNATIKNYVRIYKEISEKEFENTLKSVLDHSIRMNDKIERFKKNSNSKTDKIVLDILEQNQRTIDILKS